MTIREGRWDCDSCGTKGVLGRELACPQCGRRRPEGVRFYLPEDADIVTDEPLIERAEAGADWLCEFCGASNLATREACKQCGAPRGESPAQAVQEYDEEAVPRSGEQPIPQPPPPPPKPFPWAIVASVVAALLLLLAVGGFFLFRSTETTATVTGFSWERAIEIEELREVTEEGSSVPSGGRLVREEETEVEERVEVGTETYVCGQIDMGNGMFKDKECERPVYETRYRTETTYVYEIDKWLKDRTEQESGTDKAPRWPSFDLGQDEREGKRTESYTLHLQDSTKNDKSYDIDLKEDTWKTYEKGDTVTLKVNALGATIAE